MSPSSWLERSQIAERLLKMSTLWLAPYAIISA